MAKDLLILVLVIFGVFRAAHVFSREDGPWDIFHKAREAVIKKWGLASWQARGIECLWCESVWISGFSALFLVTNFRDWIIYAAGIAGIVLVLDKLTNKG